MRIERCWRRGGTRRGVFRRGADLELAAGLALESELFGRSVASGDRNEGMAAFLEKRAPKFEDR